MTRVLFFAIVLVPTDKAYMYALLTDPLPTIFKLLCVCYINKYKLHCYYVARLRRAQPWVRWVILLVEITCVIVPLSKSFLYCKMSDDWVYLFAVALPQILFDLALMIASLVLLYLLNDKLNFGFLK